MPGKILIKNGKVVNADVSVFADVLVEDGLIAKVAKNLSDPDAQVIDAAGMLVMPGGLDAHVHMELPFMGTVSKDDFYTGTRAGLAGGTTMIMDFAIPGPGETLLDCYDRYMEKGEKACSDWGLHGGIVGWNDETMPKEIEILTKERGINSFKMFLAYKGALMISDENAAKAMRTMKKFGAIPMVHAENGDIIDMLQKDMIAKGITGPEGHAQSRPAYLEGEAVRRITTIAQSVKSPIYVVHVMSIDALEEVDRAKRRGVSVIGEPVLAGLTLSEEKMYDKDWLTAARHVMSPPIRPPEHKAALLDALSTRILDLVCTDHCVFDKDQKMMGRDDFRKIPNGLHGVEHRIPVLFDLAVSQTGKLTENDFVRVTSTTAARIFNIYPRKGAIMEGSDADICILDPKMKWTISKENSYQNVDYNAFEGKEITGAVMYTISRGKLVWDRKNGALMAERGAGRFVRTEPFTPFFPEICTKEERNVFTKVERE